MSRDIWQELRDSNVWDPRYDLPLVPMHLNPHIYAAYVFRILKAQPIDSKDPSFSATEWLITKTKSDALQVRYREEFLAKCEKQVQVAEVGGQPRSVLTGLITTSPGSGVASHDDVHGAAYLSQQFAKRCLRYLSEHDGSYTDQPLTQPNGSSDLLTPEEHNYYRFLYFEPAIRAASGERMGLLNQLQFTAALLGNLWFTKPGSTDGHLLLWLSFPALRQFPLVAAFIDYWSDRQTKAGLTPKVIFQKYYLTECPWFGDWAPEDWK